MCPLYESGLSKKLPHSNKRTEVYKMIDPMAVKKNSSNLNFTIEIQIQK